MSQQITRRGKRYVRINCDHWATFVRETIEATGASVKLPEANSGRAVKIDVASWSLLLAVIKVAVKAAVAQSQEENCCDEVCEGHGGCDFGFGTIAVCNDDDVFICGVT